MPESSTVAGSPGQPPASVAFCVLSHRNPEQITRLAERLLNAGSDIRVLIHHDASATEQPDATQLPVGATLLPRPRSLSWGDGRDVLATLDLLAAARETGSAWVVLLSGQDYPLRPVEELIDELLLGPSDARIDSVPAAENGGWSAVEATARYGYRHLRLSALPGPLAVAAKALARLSRVGGPTETLTPLLCRWRVGTEEWLGVRRRPHSYPVHVGSQWFAASAPVVDEILAHSRQHPQLLRSMRGSILPDEAYFQTVLASLARDHTDAPLRIGPGLHAVEHDGPRATTVTLETLPRYLESSAWFCRKVDLASDPAVLDRLDSPDSPDSPDSLGSRSHEDRLPASAA